MKPTPLALAVLLACGPRSADRAEAEEPAKVVYWPTVAARASSPLGITGSLGVIRSRGTGQAQFCKYEIGWLSAQVEAGSGGGQVSIGVAALCSEKRWIHFTPGSFAMAAAIRATYARTWGQPWGNAEPGTNYLGAYLDLGPPIVSLRIGFLKPVGVPQGRDDGAIVYFGGAIGF